MQTILYHAKLYVARGDFRSALCAEDGIIRAVGSDAEILALARPGCRRIDCGGRTVVPGFNDSHLHLMQLAETRYEAPISGVRSVDELVERSLRGAAIWDEVKDRLKKNALGLSGGQQQRLCIARALAVEPAVLLMDEPTSALDPISTSRIEELTMELKERYTIVIVTHNMQQAVRISDRTAFFLLGELVEYGATEQVFSAPAEKRTEDYITGRFG